MVNFVKFASCNLPDDKKLITLNTYRSSYGWSQKVYEINDVQNIYFIKHQGYLVGYVEIEYMNLDISIPREGYIFLHEIHIAKSMQGKSIGFQVISSLLKKLSVVEMVVVNVNSGMVKLVNKFNVLNCYKGENTSTYRITS
ncbi:GNAT family N-acetyltransferase [Escherichia coli]